MSELLLILYMFVDSCVYYVFVDDVRTIVDMCVCLLMMSELLLILYVFVDDVTTVDIIHVCC